MKQKHIDASREIRLWVAQIFAPIATVYFITHPEKLEKARDAMMRMEIKRMFGF